MARPRSSTSPPRSIPLPVVCLLGFVTTAFCVLSAAQSETRRDQPSIRTLRVVDEAIHALGDPASDYRKVLLHAAAALPSNAEDDVRAHIRTFLGRSPEPGPAFRCSVDFVRARARKMLLRLRDTLQHADPGGVDPAVCYAVPFALDVTHAPTTDSRVDIYGYDFDAVTPQMVLVTRDGYQDVTSALIARSHAHLTFKLDGVPLSSNSLSLGLAWGHLIRHSIALVHRATPVCSSRVETIPAGKTIVTAPLRTSGEGSLARPGTKIWADASLDYSNNKLEATICMTADQAANDTIFSGCTVEFLYTTDPDGVIEGVLGTSRSHISYTRATSQPADIRNAAAQGPVRQWAFSSGDVSMTARLNEIRIVSTDDRACISPLAYLEARRTAVLSPETKRALDSQLTKVAPRILTLRPRFAPPSFDGKAP